jgi:hypothetical protein
MLKTLLITALLAQSAPENLSSGADLQAWRTLGPEASTEALNTFLSTYSQSPLAELAVRRLEAQGASLPTAKLADVLESVLNHDAQLAQVPASVAIATVTMTPLSPSDRPAPSNPPLADANDTPIQAHR